MLPSALRSPVKVRLLPGPSRAHGRFRHIYRPALARLRACPRLAEANSSCFAVAFWHRLDHKAFARRSDTSLELQALLRTRLVASASFELACRALHPGQQTSTACTCRMQRTWWCPCPYLETKYRAIRGHASCVHIRAQKCRDLSVWSGMQPFTGRRTPQAGRTSALAMSVSTGVLCTDV